MLIAGKRMPGGGGLAGVLLRRAATVALDWDVRQKSRFDTVDSTGRALGVVLPRGTVLRGGDVLVADDGSLVRVVASPQPVLRVTAAPGSDPHALARAAYHLGNRHVPLEVGPSHLQLEPDHVLAEMLQRMGFAVAAVDAPFEPEGGAYDGTGHGSQTRHSHAAQGHEHRHDHAAHGHAEHGRGHGHGDHGQHEGGHEGHDHAAGPAHPHVHGPGCGHDHG